jgi:hypothetical protein
MMRVTAKQKKQRVVMKAVEEMFKLSHGSGLDGDIDELRVSARGDKVFMKSALHVMDENGYYYGWLHFTMSIPIKSPMDYKIMFRNFSHKTARQGDIWIWRDLLEQRFDTVFQDCLDRAEAAGNDVR